MLNRGHAVISPPISYSWRHAYYFHIVSPNLKFNNFIIFHQIVKMFLPLYWLNFTQYCMYIHILLFLARSTPWLWTKPVKSLAGFIIMLESGEEKHGQIMVLIINKIILTIMIIIMIQGSIHYCLGVCFRWGTLQRRRKHDTKRELSQSKKKR